MGRRVQGGGERTCGIDVGVALHFGDEDGELVRCGYACAVCCLAFVRDGWGRGLTMFRG